MFKFAAKKLQLFLARNNDDTWLDSSTGRALTLDGNGHPEGFLHMDPPLSIKNPKYFGETFQPCVGRGFRKHHEGHYVRANPFLDLSLPLKHLKHK